MLEILKFGAAAGIIAATAWMALADRPLLKCEEYTPAEGMLVAHAGSGLPEKFYANDLKALNLAASHGFALVELDFIERDGELLLGHDMRRLSDTRLSELMAWLDRHASVSVITDLKTENISGLRLLREAAGHRQARFIPQIYRIEQYEPALALGYQLPIFAVGRDENPGWLEWVNSVPLWAVTIPHTKKRLVPNIDHPVFLFTLNEPTEGYDGLYTDCLVPAKLNDAS